MRPRWKKTIRDLLQQKARTVLVILAIAVGLSGFGVLLSTYSILTRELTSGYLETDPASATLHLDQINEEVSSIVRNFPGIDRFESRRSFGARVRINANEWRNAVLFVIEDFNNLRVSKLKPFAGKWPPDAGEILIERDAMGVARGNIGSAINIRMPSGLEKELIVAGTVHDAGQAQARMEQIVYGYINVETLQMLGEPPNMDELKIIVAGEKFNKHHIATTVQNLKTELERRGYKVLRLDVPEPGKHPHADLMGTLLLYKGSFGLFALLLSGILVSNLMSALMAGQIRQIGMMKSIGARRIQITGIYLGGVAILSLAALVIAIPISIAGGRMLSVYMSRFLNFDLKDFSISLWVFVLQAAAGIVIPLLCSLFPVFKGSRISVREALADYGISQNAFGSGWFDRLISKVRGLASPILLSIRNTFRKRARLVLTLATLAAGGTIFLAAWNLRASLIHTADLMFASTAYDISISFAELYPARNLMDTALNTDGVDHVEYWTSAEASVVNGDGSSANPFVISGVPVGSKTLYLNIVEGRALTPDDTNALIINNRLAAAQPSLRVGTKIKIRIAGTEQEWLVAGLARQPFGGAAAFANREYLSDLTKQSGLAGNIKILTKQKDRSPVDAAKRMLEENFSKSGFKITGNVSMAERRRVLDEHNSVIYTFLIVLAFLIVGVGGLGLMTVMSINVMERRREIGVMRVIGATQRKIMSIILLEGALIGAISWLIAIAAAALISNTLGNVIANLMFRTNLDSVIDGTAIVAWFLIVLIFGTAASFLPARNASRLTVRELVGYE